MFHQVYQSPVIPNLSENSTFFLLENYRVKKRRSKAKYSYFIVHFDPLAADTCTAAKSKATRTCQDELMPGSPVVNSSLLFKSKFCVGFPCLLVIPLFRFFLWIFISTDR